MSKVKYLMQLLIFFFFVYTTLLVTQEYLEYRISTKFKINDATSWPSINLMNVMIRFKRNISNLVNLDRSKYQIIEFTQYGVDFINIQSLGTNSLYPFQLKESIAKPFFFFLAVLF